MNNNRYGNLYNFTNYILYVNSYCLAVAKFMKHIVVKYFNALGSINSKYYASFHINNLFI